MRGTPNGLREGQITTRYGVGNLRRGENEPQGGTGPSTFRLQVNDVSPGERHHTKPDLA